MVYLLIRDCDYDERGDAVDVVDAHMDLDVIRKVKTFVSDRLHSFSLSEGDPTEIELKTVTQDDDPLHTSFPAKIYRL